MIKKHHHHLATHSKKFIQVSAGILLVSQIALGSLPASAEVDTSNQVKAGSLMNKSLKLGMLRTPIAQQVTGPITTEADLNAAIANATGGTLENPVEIILGAALTLTNTIDILGSDRHILLKPESGNTRITRGSNAVFRVNNSASLTLEDVTIDGEDRVSDGSLIYVDSNGTLNLNSGSEVMRGNSGTEFGGGIYATNSTVNINGGTISDNRSESNGGGGILGFSSTINVNSGSIRNNSSNQHGGGIYADKSTINLNGGQIVDNKVTDSSYNGNNIYLRGSDPSNQATLNTTNGVIYNEKVSGVDSIYKVNESSNWDGPKEKAIVIERAENPSASYTAGTEDELSFTADASSINSPTVNWAYRNGVSGIAYQNDDNTGFFEVDDVTVNRVNVTDQLSINDDKFTYNGLAQGITRNNISGFNRQNFGALTIEYAEADSSQYGNKMPTQAGNYLAKVQTAGGDVYHSYSNAFPFTIEKAIPTQTDFTYPEATQLAYRNEGWDMNDQINAKDESLKNYTVSYLKDGKETATMTQAGTYQIKITVEDNDNFNKTDFIISDATVTVGEKAQPEAANFQGNIAKSYEYSGTQPAIEIASDIPELEGVETIIKQGGNESASTNVGEYQVYARTKETTNYAAADVLLGSFDITEKVLTVAAENTSSPLGATLPTPIISYDGFVTGQTAGAIFSSLPTASHTSDGKTAGTFEIILTPGVKAPLGNNYAIEYVSGRLTVTSDSDRLPLYRVYNKNNGEHLYTLSQSEAQGLIDKGWQDEGIGWYGGEKTGKAAYRLYNPNSGEHFYTLDQAEYDSVGEAGWNKEGIAFYASEDTEIPIFRVFNPNAQDAGSHHYTLSTTENTGLVREGWRSEGVGFYGK
ncbi:MBG domain-containing protein [Enterococcus alishanensis]